MNEGLLGKIFFLKRFLPFIVMGLLIVAIIAGIVMVRQRQEIRSKATLETAVLRFSLNSLGNKEVGETFPVLDVIIDAKSNNITGVDFEIEFDDSKLDALGEFTPRQDNSLETVIIPGSGRSGLSPNVVRFVAVNKNDAQIMKSGTFILGSLQFKAAAKTTGLGTIKFKRAQVIAADRIDMEVPLDITSTATYSIGSDCIDGDANGDGCVDIENDFRIWKSEYLSQTGLRADFYDGAVKLSRCSKPGKTGDSKIDGLDYTEWKRNLNSPNRCGASL